MRGSKIINMFYMYRAGCSNSCTSYMHTYIYTYIRTCMHTYINTYTHTHTYTYIHIHAYAGIFLAEEAMALRGEILELMEDNKTV